MLLLFFFGNKKKGFKDETEKTETPDKTEKTETPKKMYLILSL
jgi:hypothetical protein